MPDSFPNDFPLLDFHQHWMFLSLPIFDSVCVYMCICVCAYVYVWYTVIWFGVQYYLIVLFISWVTSNIDFLYIYRVHLPLWKIFSNLLSTFSYTDYWILSLYVLCTLFFVRYVYYVYYLPTFGLSFHFINVNFQKAKVFFLFTMLVIFSLFFLLVNL